MPANNTQHYRSPLIGSDSPEGDVSVTRITGADLNQSSVGKFLGRNEGTYNRMGKILQLIPVLTDPNGLWLATIRWGQTPDKPAQNERVQIRFDQEIELVEISEG